MDEDPKSEMECMLSVVDPKGNGQNKYRYIVATLDEELVCWPAASFFPWVIAHILEQRDRLRSVVPTPLMYVRRSVVVSLVYVDMVDWMSFGLTSLCRSLSLWRMRRQKSELVKSLRSKSCYP